MDKYDSLKLDNQLCFPLYACSKEIVRQYKPYLDKLNLTYTQYITMMVIWEAGAINVGDLGKKLYLESNTLTPVLKTLEKNGYIKRERSIEDERILIVSATKEGMDLREKALEVPKQMSGCFSLSEKETYELYSLLHKIMEQF